MTKRVPCRPSTCLRLALPLAVALAGAVAAGEHDAPTAAWAVKGTMAEACQCTVFCPCEFAEAPTHGHCDDTAVLTIDEGHFGGVDLAGTQVVVVLQSPEGERLVDTIGRLNFARVFVPEGTTPEQGKALEAIAARVWAQFEGGDNRLADDQKIVPTPMEVMLGDGEFAVRIPDVLDLHAEAALGADGKTPFVIQNMVPPGMSDVEVYRSTRYRYTYDDQDWDYNGRSASLRTFDLAGDQ